MTTPINSTDSDSNNSLPFAAETLKVFLCRAKIRLRELHFFEELEELPYD